MNEQTCENNHCQCPCHKEEPAWVLHRFLRFGGLSYYPDGGWDDFMGAFATLEEAQAGEPRDWSHVVDTHTGTIVAHTTYTWDNSQQPPRKVFTWEESK